MTEKEENEALAALLQTARGQYDCAERWKLSRAEVMAFVRGLLAARPDLSVLGRHLKTGHTSTGQNRPTGSGASRRGWGLPHAGLRRQGVVGGLCDGNRKVRLRSYVG